MQSGTTSHTKLPDERRKAKAPFRIVLGKRKNCSYYIECLYIAFFGLVLLCYSFIIIISFYVLMIKKS